MKKYDLHVHSKYSLDCLTEPSKLVKVYNKKGFSGFAITDHDHFAGYKEALDYAKEKKIDIEVIGGCEFKSAKREIIGLYIQEIKKSNDFFEICDFIHEQGGFVVLPHPFDTSKKHALNPHSLSKEELRQIDVIEVFNSSVLDNKANAVALEFAKQRNLPQCAGSDSHLIWACGSAATLIESDIDLSIALRKGLTKVEGKINPFFYRGIPSIIKFLRKSKLIGV